MPARIKYAEGDYVDPEHNLLFIRDVSSISLIRIPYTDFNKIDAQYILDKIQEVK